MIIIVLLFILGVLFIGLSIYLYKNKNTIPVATPYITNIPIETPIPTIKKPVFTNPPPIQRGSTNYPLTEQMIMLKFNKKYYTPYSQEIFNDLLQKNINQNITERFFKNNPNKNLSLNCYVLYTNTFIPEQKRQQGSNLQISGSQNVYFEDEIIENVSDFPEDYDIIGAYFFYNIDKFLPPNSNCLNTIYYYDLTKKIVIDKQCLSYIYSNIKGNIENDNNNYFMFTNGEMPMDLDNFVPRISKYLFYGFGVNIETIEKYNIWKQNC